MILAMLADQPIESTTMVQGDVTRRFVRTTGRISQEARNNCRRTIGYLTRELRLEPVDERGESDLLRVELLLLRFVFILVAVLEPLLGNVLRLHTHKVAQRTHHRLVRREVEEQHLVASSLELLDEWRARQVFGFLADTGHVVDLQQASAHASDDDETAHLLLALFAVVDVLRPSAVDQHDHIVRLTSSSEV